METLLNLLRAPAWPILLWCGFAAALAAALVLPPRQAIDQQRAGAPLWPLTLVLGVACFAPLYGLGFEQLGRADLALGAAFGLAHGLFAAAVSIARGRRPASHLARTLSGWVVYGVTVGFLYPVPPT